MTSRASDAMRKALKNLNAAMGGTQVEFAKIGRVFVNIHDEVMVSAFGGPPRRSGARGRRRR